MDRSTINKGIQLLILSLQPVIRTPVRALISFPVLNIVLNLTLGLL